ncbi:hypothetical protein XYCOK13_04750 [Xylanibacillus composti]|uniref:Uncharacterized protein n=1 Tax=Xylanibacillus composti TaxID=1572762 RepID=A0A8J4H140_9BACL|nr:hypothetical protein XYCOK13_04750 [Xylanibacillus composti]
MQADRNQIALRIPAIGWLNAEGMQKLQASQEAEKTQRIVGDTKRRTYSEAISSEEGSRRNLGRDQGVDMFRAAVQGVDASGIYLSSNKSAMSAMQSIDGADNEAAS